jgi:RNA polymerase sigma-70 factor (ECF subfamily)
MTPNQYICLFKSYYIRAVNLCRIYAITKEDAEDIVTFAFVRLWQDRDKIDYKGVSTLLFTIIKNKCIDLHRHKKYRVNYLRTLDERAFIIDPFADIETKHIANDIWEIIETLPIKQNQAMRLKYVNDKNIKDILLEHQEINRNTLKNTLLAAVKNIRKELKKRGIEYRV